MHDVTAHVPELRAATSARSFSAIFERARVDTAPGILVRQILDLFELVGEDRRDMEQAMLLLHNHSFESGREWK